MARARAVIDRVLAVVLTGIMAIMVVNVIWQVFTRFVLGAPSSYTEELARYLLIWVSLLGAAYAAGQRLHLAIDVFTSGLTGRRRVRMDWFIQGCVFLFAFGAMVVGGVRLVYISFALEQMSAALRVSLGYVYLVVPISGLLIMFYTAGFLLDQAAGRRAAAPVRP
jgi:TRAP-type C4-dicarboxylate transport system permease small subunit